jgi:hypothetical protein
MQMTVRFSFKRSGEMIGPAAHDVCHGGRTGDTRDTYLKAINARWTPACR